MRKQTTIQNFLNILRMLKLLNFINIIGITLENTFRYNLIYI